MQYDRSGSMVYRINMNNTMGRFESLLSMLVHTKDCEKSDKIAEQINDLAKMNDSVAYMMAEMLEKGNVFTQDEELAEFYKHMSDKYESERCAPIIP